jgi:hypothetical protein
MDGTPVSDCPPGSDCELRVDDEPVSDGRLGSAGKPGSDGAPTEAPSSGEASAEGIAIGAPTPGEASSDGVAIGAPVSGEVSSDGRPGRGAPISGEVSSDCAASPLLCANAHNRTNARISGPANEMNDFIAYLRFVCIAPKLPRPLQDYLYAAHRASATARYMFIGVFGRLEGEHPPQLHPASTAGIAKPGERMRNLRLPADRCWIRGISAA